LNFIPYHSKHIRAIKYNTMPVDTRNTQYSTMEVTSDTEMEECQ
jgi:hypothetical protein